MMLRLLPVLLAFLIALPAPAKAPADTLAVRNLRCNFLTNPLGLDDPAPGLSWQMQSGVRGKRQTAYRILVASSPERLAEGRADVWDSGKVASDQSVQVSYGGAALQARQRYYWKVQVWDKDGLPGSYSEPAWWEMGLLNPGDWSARWISAVSDADTSLAPRPAPLFRTEFAVSKPVQKARLYLSGLGYFEASLNGSKIGDHVLDPALTRYDRRVLYVSFDVTDYLQPGDNAFGAVLGNGWYNMHTRSAWDFDRAPWRDQPTLLAQLEITYADGSREVIASSDAWKVAAGPIVFDGIHNGETYDARREREGWRQPGFDDAAWDSAYVVSEPSGKLVPQVMPPIRVVRTLPPERISTPEPGVQVYDFGENITGWARLRVRGPAGAEVVIRYGERLNEDGTLDQQELSRFVWTGETQTGRYILKGDGEESWRARFAYHGFQYAEVTAPPGAEITGLEAEVVHTDFESAGQFACSNPLLNRIHAATRNSFLGNFHGYPTDCPHREKMGWTGDAHLVAETGLYNFDAVTAYLKWIDDFVDEQRENGQIPGIIPTSGWGYTFGKDSRRRERGYGPQWEAAFVLIPWYLYLHTGDQGILERYYEPLRRYVEYLARHAENYTLSFGIDDHKALGDPTEPPILATGHFYTSARVLAGMAARLGKDHQEAYFSALADSIRAGYQYRFIDPATGRVGDGRQTSLAGALYHGLADSVQAGWILDALLEEISAADGHTDAGVVGVKYVLNALTDYGEAETVYRMASKRTFPSWGYWIEQGATTLWQNWDGTQSRNHIMFGSIDEWFYETLAGIRYDPDQPGFKRSIIKPAFIDSLEWVRGAHDTMYGRIRSAWRREPGGVALELDVPPNTTAEVHLPGADPSLVREGDSPAGAATGVRFLGIRAGHLVYEVGSGTYRFSLHE